MTTAIRWWRAADGIDHAFRGGSVGYLSSLCRQVRWTVRMTPTVLPRPSAPCPNCEAALRQERATA